MVYHDFSEVRLVCHFKAIHVSLLDANSIDDDDDMRMCCWLQYLSELANIILTIHTERNDPLCYNCFYLTSLLIFSSIKASINLTNAKQNWYGKLSPHLWKDFLIIQSITRPKIGSTHFLYKISLSFFLNFRIKIPCYFHYTYKLDLLMVTTS